MLQMFIAGFEPATYGSQAHCFDDWARVTWKSKQRAKEFHSLVDSEGCGDSAYALLFAKRLDRSTYGLVAMTSAPCAEGRQFDPGQVDTRTADQHACVWSRKLVAI